MPRTASPLAERVFLEPVVKNLIGAEGVAMRMQRGLAVRCDSPGRSRRR